ncbi:hypothetical protein [Variovorax sp. GB1P17]|uniref:hypothetical protein n=1 Tax=Variovorax sp. GB1P17 TaxID=3443740 RepID=UPI003F4669A6
MKKFESGRARVLRLCAVVSTLAFAASTSFSGTLRGGELDQSLQQGAWCTDSHDGKKCQTYEVYREGLIFGCANPEKPAINEQVNFASVMSYKVEGDRICIAFLAAAKAPPPMVLSTEPACGTVFEINAEFMRYKLDLVDEVSTDFRIPRDGLTCPGPPVAPSN